MSHDEKSGPDEPGNGRPKSALVTPLCILLGLLFLSAGPLTLTAQVGIDQAGGLKGTRNAEEFPGASIVEKVQAAISDCGLKPCKVYIPSGTYNSSPISSWKNRDSHWNSCRDCDSVQRRDPRGRHRPHYSPCSSFAARSNRHTVGQCNGVRPQHSHP